MRKLLFILSVIICTQLAAQKATKTEKLPPLDTAKMNAQIRSMNESTNAYIEKMNRELTEKSIQNMNNNTIAFVKMQEEQKKKQLRSSIIRISIGVVFLIVLIIGWRRKKKTQVS